MSLGEIYLRPRCILNYGKIVNTTFKQHNRTVYSSQAIRHVARQIETLYWNSVSPENGREDIQRTAIDKGTDLTNSAYVLTRDVELFY